MRAVLTVLAPWLDITHVEAGAFGVFVNEDGLVGLTCPEAHTDTMLHSANGSGVMVWLASDGAYSTEDPFGSAA